MARFLTLEKLRLERNMTQQEVANLLYCQREVYRRYETGEREVPVWVVIKLAHFYQVTTDYILEVSTIRNPYTKQEDVL